MSNKKEKKKNERHDSIERTIIPLFLRIYLSSPPRFLQSFPTIFVHHFSLSLSLLRLLSPTLLFLFPRRKYRQGYRGVLREDLVFTWPETRYPRYTQGCLPTCFTLAVKIRLSAHGLFLATSRASSTLVGGVLFFRWLAKLARTDSISNYGHSISPE